MVRKGICFLSRESRLVAPFNSHDHIQLTGLKDATAR